MQKKIHPHSISDMTRRNPGAEHSPVFVIVVIGNGDFRSPWNHLGRVNIEIHTSILYHMPHLSSNYLVISFNIRVVSYVIPSTVSLLLRLKSWKFDFYKWFRIMTNLSIGFTRSPDEASNIPIWRSINTNIHIIVFRVEQNKWI